ncbi:MAG: 1-acyl-sn-glycerol-3-phosphate acyltransferase [Candidatus Nanopelagicales bacterium]|jgi:glycerol-3-phosphate O-acyltransferase
MQLTAAEIIASPEFAARVAQLVEQTGRTPEDVSADARRCLEEMVATIEPRSTQAWDRFGAWLSRSYSVDASTDRLRQIRELGLKHSLVFLPNHRSYLDPLVLRRVLSKHGFPPNYVLGGMNLAKWPASVLAKRAGLIFIRRSTRDDPVYPAMMRLYLGCLLKVHANLEWYFEGGRTRTGKLRPPRMGVLRYLLDAFVENLAEPGSRTDQDVYIVPVSIVYDQQHEVEAISFEDTGGSKTPESLKWLYGFARAQSTRRGQVHVRFGEPLSLLDTLEDARERAGSAEPETVVPRVAFEIANRINAATPITPSALITFALLDNEGRALTLGELLDVLDPLLVYVRERQLPLTSDIDIARPDGLRTALRTLQAEGVVEVYDGGLEPVFAVAPDRFHEAAFYRNTLAHWFVYRAVTENALLAAADAGGDVVDTTWQAALELRDLLKFEFFFPRKREFAEDIRREVDLARPGWSGEGFDRDGVLQALDQTHLYVSHRIIGPFLEAYYVVAARLADREPAAPVDRDALVQECLGIAKQDWLMHRLHSPESISRDLMQGALKLADNRGLLGVGGEELRKQREDFRDELRSAVERVGIVRRAAMAQIEGDGRRTISRIMRRR